MVRTIDGDKVVVGQCPRCRVRFVAAPPDRDLTASLLVAHTAICPGGSRDGESVEPSVARLLLRAEMLVPA